MVKTEEERFYEVIERKEKSIDTSTTRVREPVDSPVATLWLREVQQAGRLVTNEHRVHLPYEQTGGCSKRSCNEMRWRERINTLDRCPIDVTCHGIKM